MIVAQNGRAIKIDEISLKCLFEIGSRFFEPNPQNTGNIAEHVPFKYL